MLPGNSGGNACRRQGAQRPRQRRMEPEEDRAAERRNRQSGNGNEQRRDWTSVRMWVRVRSTRAFGGRSWIGLRVAFVQVVGFRGRRITHVFHW